MFSTLGQTGRGSGGGGLSPNVIILLIFFGLSAISWVLRALKEQSAKRRAKQAQQARADEALRTGRSDAQPQSVSSASTSAPISDEAEAKRRLMELRKQRAPQQSQSSAQPQPAQGQSGGPVTAELWPGGPVIVIGPAGAPKPATAQAQPRPQPQARPQQRPQPQARPQPRPQPQRANQPKPRPQARPDPRPEPMLDRQRPQRAEVVAAVVPQYKPEMPNTPDQWRNAFIAAEVFGKPVGLREPS